MTEAQFAALDQMEHLLQCWHEMSPALQGAALTFAQQMLDRAQGVASLPQPVLTVDAGRIRLEIPVVPDLPGQAEVQRLIDAHRAGFAAREAAMRERLRSMREPV